MFGSFSRVLVSQQLTRFTQVRRGRRFYGIKMDPFSLGADT